MLTSCCLRLVSPAVEASIPRTVVDPEESVPSDNDDEAKPTDGLLIPSGQNPEPLAWYSIIFVIINHLRVICYSLWRSVPSHLPNILRRRLSTDANALAPTLWAQFSIELDEHKTGAVELNGTVFNRNTYYFPLTAQQALTTDSRLVAWLQSEPQAPRDGAFLEKVKQARTVLLICARQNIIFSVFQRMIEYGVSDASLPLSIANVGDLVRDGVDKQSLDKFTECQRHFRPARLGGADLKIFRFEETILPFTSWAGISRGTYSTVCKVAVNPMEHDFSIDPLEEVRPDRIVSSTTNII